MSVRVVTVTEFRRAVRSRLLLALGGLFALLTAVGAVVVSTVPALVVPTDPTGPAGIARGLTSPASILIPVIGLLVGYKTVGGSREAGTLHCLLGLPISRRAVVVGSVLGRAAAVAVAVIVGFAVGGIAALLVSGPFPLGAYLGFIAVTVLFGATFVSIGVGLSAATGSPARAAYGAFGVFAVFQFLWPLAGTALRYVTTGSVALDPPLPAVYLLFGILNPQQAYVVAMSAVLPPGASLDFPTLVTRNAGGQLPAFYDAPLALVILLAWAVGPLGLGYLRFRRADLG